MKRLQFTGDDDIDRARYEDMKAIWAAEEHEMAVRNARLDAVIATRLYPQGFDPLFPDGDASPNLWQRQIDRWNLAPSQTIRRWASDGVDA